MCDRVAVMEDGQTIEVLDKKDLYAKPQTLSTALLSGCKNFSAAEKTGTKTLFAKDWNALTLKSFKPVPDDLKYVGFRAHFFELAASVRAECAGMPRDAGDRGHVLHYRHCAGGRVAATGIGQTCATSWTRTNGTALGNPETLLLRMPEDQLISDEVTHAGWRRSEDRLYANINNGSLQPAVRLLHAAGRRREPAAQMRILRYEEILRVVRAGAGAGHRSI